MTLAEAYAMQFGAVYLNFTVAAANQRAQELATYLPGAVISADPQLGWDGSGSLRLESEQVGGISVQDPAQSALNAQLPAFFQAYASGDSATLNRFLAPGATVSGLGGALSYTGISDLYVPVGGAIRHITATVVWQLSGSGVSGPAKLEMTYDLTVIDQAGKWYVHDIAASAPGDQQTGGA